MAEIKVFPGAEDRFWEEIAPGFRQLLLRERGNTAGYLDVLDDVRARLAQVDFSFQVHVEIPVAAVADSAAVERAVAAAVQKATHPMLLALILAELDLQDARIGAPVRRAIEDQRRRFDIIAGGAADAGNAEPNIEPS
jgi:hypothetical protein